MLSEFLNRGFLPILVRVNEFLGSDFLCGECFPVLERNHSRLWEIPEVLTRRPLFVDNADFHKDKDTTEQECLRLNLCFTVLGRFR